VAESSFVRNVPSSASDPEMPHNESQPLLANETADATCGVSFGDQSTAIEAEPQTTAEQLSEMRAYGQRKLFCLLVDTALDVTTLAIVASLLAKPLDQWLESWAAFQVVWTRLGVLFLIIAVAQYAVSFPLSLYAGFLLEHKFGLSRQTLWRWFRRDLLKFTLTLAFGLVLIEGLFWLIWLTGSVWWLAAGGAAFVVSVLLGQLVPVVILPLFYKIERLDDGELLSRFQRLAAGTSLSIEGVYRMQLSAETNKANAMLAGLGRTRRVILGDTLLDGFAPEEIEVVLAHEIGHHVYHHIPKLMAMGLAFSLVSFFLCDYLLVWWLGVGFAYEHVPVHALPLLLLVVTVSSLLVSPLSNAVSRRFERQCDRYALQCTGLHRPYLSAFTKLSRLNKADPQPPWLEVFLFHDHPPIAERLSLAEQVMTSEPGSLGRSPV
jgi:STE24 endopeptidase